MPVPWHVSEHVIYEGLEFRWTVSQPKRHYKVLTVTAAGAEGRLSLIPFSDANEVVGAAEIEPGVELSSPQLFQGCWY